MTWLPGDFYVRKKQSWCDGDMLLIARQQQTVYACKAAASPPHSKLAEQIFSGGADHDSGALVRGTIAITANHDDGNAFALAH